MYTYMTGELFPPKYQSGMKRVPILRNNSNVTAATGRDAVFHTIPTVCGYFPWIVQVSKGYQSVNIMCANKGLLYYSKCLLGRTSVVDRTSFS